MWTKKIPPTLIVNLDQAGIAIVPMGRYKWAKRGSKSVPMVGQEDKRQITIVPAISAAGTAVGMQVIFQGKTERSLPVGEGRRQLDELHVHLTMTSNHWASFETMQLWVENVLVKYVKDVRIQLQHWKDHPGIAPPLLLIMDCWKVHLRADFIAYVQERQMYGQQLSHLLIQVLQLFQENHQVCTLHLFLLAVLARSSQWMWVSRNPSKMQLGKDSMPFFLSMSIGSLLRAKLQRTAGKTCGSVH